MQTLVKAVAGPTEPESPIRVVLAVDAGHARARQHLKLLLRPAGRRVEGVIDSLPD